MSSSKFSVGDLVWAKMKGYPPWPARVTNPPENLKSLAKKKKGHQCCFFFGSENYSWIPDQNISRHSDAMVPKTMKRTSAQFHKAVAFILKESADSPVKNEEQIDDKIEVEPSVSGGIPKPKVLKVKLQSRKHKKELAQTEDKLQSKKRKKLQQELAQMKDELQSRKCEKLQKELAPAEDKLQSTKRKKVQRNLAETEACSSQKSKRAKAVPKKNESPKYTKGRKVTTTKVRIDVDDDETSLPSIISDLASKSGTMFSHLGDGETSHASSFLPGYHPECLPKRPKLAEYVERCPTPEFDLFNRSEIEDISKRQIQPSSKKFGFLGLGFMGRVLAKRILFSGHDLTVWNRRPEKCEEFIEAGAHRAQTPADVMAASDLVFCCLSDTDAVKSIVFDNCGVLSGMDSAGKSFVVLSAISPDASIAIRDAIVKKDGFYLEAFVQGTRIMAGMGKMVVTAAGHRPVFNDSLSCFRSFARDAYYVTDKVGHASVLNVLINSMNAGIVHAFSTTLKLIEDNNGSIPDFLELLEDTRMYNPLLLRQADAIQRRSFETDVSVQHVEQIMDSGVGLRGNRPSVISSLVNEVFKSASFGRYFAHDITAISQTMR